MAGLIPVSRREESAEGEAWDGATWVDVGDDGRWHPSVAERTRAFVLLGILLGLLLLAAAVASIGGDDDEPVVAPATSSTTTTTEPAETTTTQPLPSSIDGETPPEPCLDDNRGAQPLREPGAVTVAVLNGARVNGLAGRVSGELTDKGYVASPGNADEADVSAIVFAEGFCAEAVAVAAEVGIGAVEPSVGEPAEGVQIEVLLGRDEFAD